MFSTLWSRLLSYLAPVGIVLSILLGAYLKGKSDQKLNDSKKDLEALKKGSKIDAKVREMLPSELDRNIDRWMRD